ncbi:MAG: NAD-dependent epimerase/dehydratase family protein [Anaerolineales bacterium]
MSNYLITGVAGFIGARTAEMLLAQGHTVSGVDNMNDAYDVRMKQYRLKRLLPMPGFTFYMLDISRWGQVERLLPASAASKPVEAPKVASMQGVEGSPGVFDGIINLAARAGVRASVENPWIFLESNTAGTLNMLELCRQTGCGKFILASTSSIYGGDPPYPTPETAPSSEPLQPYAASKKGAEAMVHAYHHLYGIDAAILRFFTVYGPAGRPDLAIFRFVQWIVEGRPVRINGDGTQSRGFTYIDDIARGIIAALKPTGYEIINLGGHEVITINDLVKLVEELTGKKADVVHGPPNPADLFTNWADVTKARELLGWSPQFNMRMGVKALIDWYMAEREWAKDVITS